jgi:hypothetical protein
MILEKGDMWSVFGKTDLFVITTNPIIRKDGAVVMGRGIAKQAADRFPELPYDFGKKLIRDTHEQAYVDVLAPTNTGVIGRYDNQIILYFMVKKHWREPAELDIIERSVRELRSALHFRGIPGGVPTSLRVDLNFPGIGNGKLKREDVLPLLEVLPDIVHVWEYEETNE